MGSGVKMQWLIRGFIGFILFFAVALVWQFVETQWERRRYPPPGRLVQVRSARLHIRCSGDGPVTVVFESGTGMSSNAWARVQPEVAKFARACSYDRPGLGWSDAVPGADSVDVLRELLDASGIPGRLILVGHSYGSELVRLFATRNRDRVRGIVLTATSYPDEKVRQISQGVSEDQMFRVYELMTRTGLIRLVPGRYYPAMFQEYIALLRRYLPAEAAEAEIAFLSHSRHVRVICEERRLDWFNEDAAACARGFRDLPLIVLVERWGRDSKADSDRQDRLAHASTRGRRVDLDCGHLIPLERPDAVIQAVQETLLMTSSTRDSTR